MHNSVFKFHQINDHSLEGLKKSEVFCNHYQAFNDPFECWSIIQKGIPHSVNEKSRYAEVYRAWGFDEPDYSAEGINQLFEYCEQFDNDYSQNISKYIDSARICCFSREISNLLMWSHYTDGLRGFCIEFDADELIKLSNKSVILKVKYKRKPVYFDTMVYSVAADQVDFHEMVIDEELSYRRYVKSHNAQNIRVYSDWLKKSKKLLFNLYSIQLGVKPLEWCYEKEMRLIFHSEKNELSGELFKYPISAVKSIIFGEKISNEDRIYITDLARAIYPKVRFGIAIRNLFDYQISINFL